MWGGAGDARRVQRLSEGPPLSSTQMTQRAAMHAFGTVHRRAWGLGLAGSLGAYIMSFYYSVVMAW